MLSIRLTNSGTAFSGQGGPLRLDIKYASNHWGIPIFSHPMLSVILSRFDRFHDEDNVS